MEQSIDADVSEKRVWQECWILPVTEVTTPISQNILIGKKISRKFCLCCCLSIFSNIFADQPIWNYYISTITGYVLRTTSNNNQKWRLPKCRSSPNSKSKSSRNLSLSSHKCLRVYSDVDVEFLTACMAIRNANHSNIFEDHLVNIMFIEFLFRILLLFWREKSYCFQMWWHTLC